MQFVFAYADRWFSHAAAHFVNFVEVLLEFCIFVHIDVVTESLVSAVP